jgi:hypothetical protein
MEVNSTCCLFHFGFLLGILFNSEDGGDMFLPRPHGIISQKIELCITTAVITSNPTCCLLHFSHSVSFQLQLNCFVEVVFKEIFCSYED